MSGLGDGQEHLPGGAAAQPAGAGWQGLWGLWPRRGTNGALSGTSGTAVRRGFWCGMAIIGVLGLVHCGVNVLSDLHDRPGLPPIEPVIWEGSSLFTLMLFLPIVWAALQLAPPTLQSRWRLMLHAPALLVFSALHVGGFMLVRKLVYALVGGHYAPGPFSDFLYEFRKDMLTYALAAMCFHLCARHFAAEALAPASSDAVFDIRDGARLTRVKLADILAVTSAGNYVEFVLADGRRPLMRSPLSALEAELGPRGFLRTHRSWLVNAGRVTGLAPEGSGDYRIELGDLAVPLSRRFPAALARLRDGGPISSRA